MEHARAFHPLDYLSVLRRRKWWLFGPAALGLIVGIALAVILPRTYKTTAMLAVGLPAMSQEQVTASLRMNSEERLRNIQQVLYSRAVLERVAREEKLDREMPLSDAVNYVRARMSQSLAPPSAALPPGTIEQFYIGFTDNTPDAAQRFANRLSDVFVEETMRRREVRAQETSAFIGQTLMASQQRLSELEEQLRTSKEAYMGALPEQTSTNVAMVASLQQQLESTTNALRGEQDRLSNIERQIESLRAGTAGAAATAGATALASPAAARVVQVERELAVARGKYTARHPEIQALEADLSAARKEAAAEAAQPPQDRMRTLAVDPAYTALQRDQAQARLRIQSLEREEGQIRRQIGDYRARVEAAPRVEQQMATLQREYALEKEQYAQVTSKMRAAETTENLVRSNGAEHFTILNRAPRPAGPDSPNIPRLMMVMILLGIVSGSALAMGREYLDRSIYDAQALTDLELPVLGQIPRIAPVSPAR